ncbi:MAG: amidoligase family protein [candidate division KSB1 bacterium]|nr:amidoligase family protein [candidate division KSB1 bacterium]
MKFKMPTRIRNVSQDIRKVGYELEFSGIDIDDAAQIILDLFGGKKVIVGKYEQKIAGTRYGDFKIELDAPLLTNEMYLEYLGKVGIDINDHPIQSSLEDFLGKLTSIVIPYEIAAPPLPVTDMGPMEELRSRLQKHGAAGTKDSIINAFGLHINVEVPSVEVGVILNYLKAYFLLYDWIFEESKIDFVRRIPPFINEFPDDYVNLVLSKDYQPDMGQFAADYLDHNATRNRTLDMLPVLAHIDEKIIQRLEGVHINPRPALHYRLPNSLVDDPEWSIAGEWNRWVFVEELAHQPEMIDRSIYDYRQGDRGADRSNVEKWMRGIKDWFRGKDTQSH